jgi:diaminopimelate epimerase
MTAEGRAFVKMEGAGNDFVVLDDRDGDPMPTAAEVRHLADRRRGVGADGVLWVGRSDVDAVLLRYWNRDGGDAFCGNGSRCAALHAVRVGLVPGPELFLRTPEATLRARVEPDAVVVDMPDPTAPRAVDLGDLIPGGGAAMLLTVGVPHVVVMVEEGDLAAVDLAVVGPRARSHPAVGAQGANVDLVARGPEGTLHLRTYERGVEAETLACGTGAVAAAVVDGGGVAGGRRRVLTRGGDWLEVEIDGSRARLRGPARVTFEGRLSSR